MTRLSNETSLIGVCEPLTSKRSAAQARSHDAFGKRTSARCCAPFMGRLPQMVPPASTLPILNIHSYLCQRDHRPVTVAWEVEQ